MSPSSRMEVHHQLHDAEPRQRGVLALQYASTMARAYLLSAPALILGAWLGCASSTASPGSEADAAVDSRSDQGAGDNASETGSCPSVLTCDPMTPCPSGLSCGYSAPGCGTLVGKCFDPLHCENDKMIHVFCQCDGAIGDGPAPYYGAPWTSDAACLAD